MNRSDGNGSSFNTSTGGAIVGIDMSFGGSKIGALFDYTTTTLDHYALGQSKVESTGGGIYAGYRRDQGFAAAAGASVAGIKARRSRTITVPGLGQTLASRSDGNT
jgi:fibronectin-binding autotransporter adhesin